jgi:hypothetical protein
MNWIVTNIRWIMLVSGALTCTMLYAALAPQAALSSMFGETLEGPVAEIVVRNWGALITIVGGMLIYGAYDPPSRPLVLTVAVISKILFIGLILGYGWKAIHYQAGISIGVDLLMVAIFIAYLTSVRRDRVADVSPPGAR